MKRFVELFWDIDASTSTNHKVEALARYYQSASAADAAWTTAFLTGNRFKRFITSRDLQLWARELKHMPEWLFAESYSRVGDTAETVALLVAGDQNLLPDTPLHDFIENTVLPLRSHGKEQQGEEIKALWQKMDTKLCFVFNKILTGAFRVGVAKATVYKALAAVSSVPPAVLAHRLTGKWQPSAEFFAQVLNPEAKASDSAKAYPFCLAYPLQAEFPEGYKTEELEQYLESKLATPKNWLAEWKWDGIRGQLLKRKSGVYLWSRGEDVISEQFPELIAAGDQLPRGTVLDGEILCWQDGKPKSFASLQKRLGRKKPSAKTLDKYPAVFMAYDLLEAGGNDIRQQPLSARRAQLQQLIESLGSSPYFFISPTINFDSWQRLEALRNSARNFGVEGLMVKHKQSEYLVGRKKGQWWKYKLDPYTVDAVLLYAQPGSGRRANLYTDYTFAVWQGDDLVPVAKAYSGLTDSEINKVDAWVRKNTVERFGPVRSVKPELVFELAFENIAPSSRHKSKLALRFPRIKRWRQDKTADQADNITMLHHLLDEKANSHTSVFNDSANAAMIPQNTNQPCKSRA